MLLGSIDFPEKDGDAVSSVIRIEGWMAGDSQLDSLELRIDGKHITSLKRGMFRKDVEREHPEFVMASESGFSYLFNSTKLKDGNYTITIEGKSKDGQNLSLSRTIVLDNAGAEQADKNCSVFFTDLSEHKVQLNNLPLRIFLEPSSLCNVSCIMCRTPQYLTGLRKAGNKIGAMSREIFEKLKPLFPHAVYILPSGWGEPYTNPLFPEMLSIIRSLNSEAQIGFNTNALLLGTEEIENLIASNVHHITVSIDSSNKTNYEHIRKGASFNTLVNNLDKIIKIRKKRRVKHPRIHFEYVVMNLNVMDMPEFVTFCANYDPESIVFANVGKLPPGFEQLYLKSHQQFIDVYLEAKSRAKKHDILLAGNATSSFEQLIEPAPTPENRQEKEQEKDSPDGREFSSGLSCHEPFQTIFVNSSGKINPCCVAATIEMGDLQHESFNEIWNNKTYQSFRSEFYAGQCPSETCTRCLANKLYPSKPISTGKP